MYPKLLTKLYFTSQIIETSFNAVAVHTGDFWTIAAEDTYYVLKSMLLVIYSWRRYRIELAYAD
jgi:hypothetical protein